MTKQIYYRDGMPENSARKELGKAPVYTFLLSIILMVVEWIRGYPVYHRRNVLDARAQQ